MLTCLVPHQSLKNGKARILDSSQLKLEELHEIEQNVTQENLKQWLIEYFTWHEEIISAFPVSPFFVLIFTPLYTAGVNIIATLTFQEWLILSMHQFPIISFAQARGQGGTMFSQKYLVDSAYFWSDLR